MAGQGLERREVLRIMALAAAASSFPGFSRWSFACGHAAPGLLQVKRKAYTPQFFSPGEYATVERLAELIIPSDDGPGAREAGVSEFVDFMVASDPKVQVRFRYGLTWLDARAQALHGAPFRELEAAPQTEILGRLAYRDRYLSGEEEGRAFFKMMRERTLMGFYTSKVGLQQLDYPGLRSHYPALPGCPHPDDPEHRRISAAPKA
jgi:gluconate 2-dehydrogenase subunit 3-like protein